MIDINKIQAVNDWVVLLFRKGSTNDSSLLKEYKFGNNVLFIPVKFNLLQYVEQVAQVISAGPGCDGVIKPGSFVLVHHFVSGTNENFIEELDNGDQIRRAKNIQVWSAVDTTSGTLMPVVGQLFCEFKKQSIQFVDTNNLISIENFAPTLNKYMPLTVEAVNPIDTWRYGIKKGDEIIVDAAGAYDIEILGKMRFKIDTGVIVGKVVEKNGEVELKSY